MSGGKQEKLIIPWDVQPVGTPVVRLRADIKIGGKVVEQRRSNLIILADWVDVTLKDPPAVTSLRQGMEGRERHVFLSGQPVPEVADPKASKPPPPAVGERQAAWSHDQLLVELDGAVPDQSPVRPDEHGVARVRFAHGTKASKIALRAEQTFYAAAWRDASAASQAEAAHKVVQPRTKVELTVTARRRISLWLAPPDWFGWPGEVEKPWKIDANGGARWTKIHDHVDDVALLNVFTPVLGPKVDQVSIRYEHVAPAQKAAKLGGMRRIIAKCHEHGTQVLLGHGGIITKISESPWLSFLDGNPLTEAQVTVLGKAVVTAVIDTDGLDCDGLDFDLEHLTTASVWSLELRARVRWFFRAMAVELQVRKKLLGIASASFVSHAHVAPNTPATGSGTGQTFTLAIECPNILMRPMCYDNAFLGAQLLAFHRDVVKFALADAAEGAGVHPAQFQIGVKTFKGTNNSTEPQLPPVLGETPAERDKRNATNSHRLKGWLQNMPTDLVQLCTDTLAPSRVGVIMFGPPFNDLPAIDAALNPLPGEKKQIKTLGTPLQAPLLK